MSKCYLTWFMRVLVLQIVWDLVTFEFTTFWYPFPGFIHLWGCKIPGLFKDIQSLISVKFKDIFRHFHGGRRFHELNSNVLERKTSQQFCWKEFYFYSIWLKLKDIHWHCYRTAIMQVYSWPWKVNFKIYWYSRNSRWRMNPVIL
jgi:hypothetical protein